jgi:hypothetical protein
MAGQGSAFMPAINYEIMSLGLAGNGLVDRGVEKFVAFRRAQWRAQVGRILLTEAHE